MDGECPQPSADSRDPEAPGPPTNGQQICAASSLPAPSPTPPVANAPPTYHSELRRLTDSVIFLLGAILVLRAIAVEPYGVPTGSMAPALAGNHKATDCPHCGYHVLVGHRGDTDESAASRQSYATAYCPNCGHSALGLELLPECPGDRLMVDKNVFELRGPQRWEMAVFRCPADLSKPFVKRVVGLPGEAVQIRDGDVYIDRALARKSLDEVRAMCVPVFDSRFQPTGKETPSRWSADPSPGCFEQVGKDLRLSARLRPQYQWVAYRHWHLDRSDDATLTDTNGYNGSEVGRRQEYVHDFLVRCTLETGAGEGSIAVTISDGQDEFIVELPTTSDPQGTRVSDGQGVVRSAPHFRLHSGKSYRLELAFVDRRLTLAIDGELPFAPIDLEPVGRRLEVKRPVKFGARGVDVVVRDVRLDRDLHYTETGHNGIASAFRLGADEYFVLGDNSPNSDDSRYWSIPAVPRRYFLGKPFLVHMPSRHVNWSGLGRRWEHFGPDWDRIRWLH